MNDEDAARESNRCLQCDLRLDIAPQRFWANFRRAGSGKGVDEQ
jgi:hypothetical protein